MNRLDAMVSAPSRILVKNFSGVLRRVAWWSQDDESGRVVHVTLQRATRVGMADLGGPEKLPLHMLSVVREAEVRGVAANATESQMRQIATAKLDEIERIVTAQMQSADPELAPLRKAPENLDLFAPSY